MAGRNHARMVFVVKCSRPKIDQTNIGVQQDTAGTSLPLSGIRGGGYLTVVVVCMVRVVD